MFVAGAVGPRCGLQHWGWCQDEQSLSSSVFVTRAIDPSGEEILWNHPVARDVFFYSQVKIKLKYLLNRLYFPIVFLIACIRMWV